MKKILGIVLAGCALAGSAMAAPIALCGGEKGQAYYPFAGKIPADKAGWTDDAITAGKVSLVINADGKLDLLFLDSTGTIASSLAEGAQVIMSAAGPDNISVIVAYNGSTTEVYDFYKNGAGELEFTHIVSKPASLIIPKVGVYVGKCDLLTFDALQ